MRPAPFLVAGAVGLVPCAAGAWLDWPAFLHAWLAATVTIGLLPLGALAGLMTFGLTGGGWGELAAPAWRAAAACLPLFVLAMVPLLFGLGELFTWTRAPELLPDVVHNKLAYLNVPFLLARLALYILVWLVLAIVMGAWSARARGGTAACAGGMLALLFTVTFFGFDWLLSLEPEFYTDVFGLLLVVTAAAAASALAVLGASGDLDTTGRDRRADLAVLWLALLLGWAFLAFAQYIVIWSGNLPHEIGWYLHRGRGFWRAVSWMVFIAFFGLPFLLLLSRRGRRSSAVLAAAAVLVLAGHALQVQWWVLPALDAGGPHLAWIAPATLATLALLFTGGLMQRWPEASRA